MFLGVFLLKRPPIKLLLIPDSKDIYQNYVFYVIKFSIAADPIFKSICGFEF